MEHVKKEAFHIVGIKVRTTNENGQAAQDIGQLWERFMAEQVANNIPNKVDNSIFSIYTNYEGDHTQPYDTILGCAVSSLEDIPEGMITQSFEASTYAKFDVQGDLTQGVVYNAWLDIWEKELDRTYTADFEVYGEKAQDPTHAALEIFVAIK